jgi:hypothetical protein
MVLLLIRPALFQIFLAEGEELLPTVHSLFLAVSGPVVIEKPMAGAVIAVKFVVLTLFL